MAELLQSLSFEYKLLIILFIVSYLGAMIVQTKDPKVDVKLYDWFVAGLISPAGGILTFLAIENLISNIGIRACLTVIASLYSYRVFKHIVSNDSQDNASGKFSKALSEVFDLIYKLLKKTK